MEVMLNFDLGLLFVSTASLAAGTEAASFAASRYVLNYRKARKFLIKVVLLAAKIQWMARLWL